MVRKNKIKLTIFKLHKGARNNQTQSLADEITYLRKASLLKTSSPAL
jgi:hypothetical protein